MAQLPLKAAEIPYRPLQWVSSRWMCGCSWQLSVCRQSSSKASRIQLKAWDKHGFWHKSRPPRPVGPVFCYVVLLSALLCAGNQAAKAAGNSRGPWQAVQQPCCMLPAAGAVFKGDTSLRSGPAGALLCTAPFIQWYVSTRLSA